MLLQETYDCIDNLFGLNPHPPLWKVHFGSYFLQIQYPLEFSVYFWHTHSYTGSCVNFVGYTVLQAVIILVAMANGKDIWRLKFRRKSPIGNQQIKKETYSKIVNNRTNLIYCSCGGITCLSLFPSHHSETQHNA